MLQSADSIIIVYHEVTAGLVIKKDKQTSKARSLQKLVVNGKLNNKIVYQKSVLTDSSILRLSNIITRPFQDTKVKRSPCHICEHSILIFTRGKISFIDISFDCRTIVDTSKDIKISEFDFDNRKWSELVFF